MSEVVSFENYRPPARFDTIPWTQAQIHEGDAFDGPWTVIDTVALVADPDPADPAEQSFTTPNGTAPDLWYTVTFLDGSAGSSTATTPVQNTSGGTTPYATTDDLFRVLKVRTPSDDQTEAAQGDLSTATLEINSELDLNDDHLPLTTDQLDLLRNVCVNRAADLWRHRESAPGILGIVDESVPQTPGRYSWARYASMLSPLKDQWGLA